MCAKVNAAFDENNLSQINRIAEELIARALQMMKSNTKYALFDSQSDCLSNGLKYSSTTSKVINCRK